MTGSSAKNAGHYGISTYAIANAKRAWVKNIAEHVRMRRGTRGIAPKMGQWKETHREPLFPAMPKNHSPNKKRLLRRAKEPEKLRLEILERDLGRELDTSRPATTQERVANAHVARRG